MDAIEVQQPVQFPKTRMIAKNTTKFYPKTKTKKDRDKALQKKTLALTYINDKEKITLMKCWVQPQKE